MKINASFLSTNIAFGPVPGRLGAQLRPTDDWYKFKALYESIPYAIEAKGTQQALAAGAREIKKGILEVAPAAFNANRIRKRPGPRAYRNQAKKGRVPTDPTQVNRLARSVAARQGKWRYFPSAIVVLSVRGGFPKAPRTAHVVDQGHAGPKPNSPRTPPHPFIMQGIVTSAHDRDKAMLKAFQQRVPQIIQEARMNVGLPPMVG